MEVKAYAKINLFLEVTGVRPDRYHGLSTIFQSISLYDTLTFNPSDSDISLTCSSDTIPVDSSNLVWKAAALLKEKYSVKEGVSMHLEKEIPVGAGLGGGSSDAAAVLRGLNTFWDLKLSPTTLQDLGAQLGMDVPFFIRGGTAFAIERGEVIAQYLPTPEFWMVLVYPNLFVSTKEVYQQLDEKVYYRPESPQPILNCIRLDQRTQLSALLYNRLESVTLPLYPPILEIKEALSLWGCEGVLMSGSGSSIFGICRTQEEAEKKAEQIQKQFGYWAKAVHTTPAI